MHRPPPTLTLFPYTTLFRSHQPLGHLSVDEDTKGTRGVRAISRRPEHGPRRSASRLRRDGPGLRRGPEQFLRLVATDATDEDRKSTRLNSSHDQISYAVFCLNAPTTTDPHPLSLHDALPISSTTRTPLRRRGYQRDPRRPSH